MFRNSAKAKAKILLDTLVIDHAKQGKYGTKSLKEGLRNKIWKNTFSEKNAVHLRFHDLSILMFVLRMTAASFSDFDVGTWSCDATEMEFQSWEFQ